MPTKFGRDFRLTIDMKDGHGPILITMPFTIRFSIQRMALSDLNTASIEVYNLSKSNRKRIFQDPWNWQLDPSLPSDTAPGRTVKLELGYQNLYQVFTGTIIEASSSRYGGDPDIITRIEAQSGHYDIAASKTFQTVESGQSLAQIIQLLIGQFSNLQLGAVGSFPQIMQRPVVLNGSTWDLLKKYSDGNVYIDNGKVYVLQPNETVQAPIYQINNSTGLLGTPRRTGGSLVAESLLEAGVEMFSQVALESVINPIYNGTYRVNGIKHEGVISGAVNGRATTTLILNAPQQFNNFKNVQGQ